MGHANKMEGTSNKLKKILFNTIANEGKYPSAEKYQDHLLEQYKIYVESADRISARRQTANSFFLSINTGIIALLSYIHLGADTKYTSEYFWLVALAGIVLSFMWYKLIRAYRDLNSGKYKVIHEIEKSLPISPYDAEWDVLGKGKESNLYLPFTHIEVGIPWIFMFLHFIVFVRSFPWESLKF